MASASGDSSLPIMNSPDGTKRTSCPAGSRSPSAMFFRVRPTTRARLSGPPKETSLHVSTYRAPEWLKKPIQQLAAALIQRIKIPDQEMNAVAVSDKQGGCGKATNIVFPFEDEAGVATISFHIPNAGRGKGGDPADTLISGMNSLLASSSSSRIRIRPANLSGSIHTSSCPSASTSETPSAGAPMGKACTGTTPSCATPSAAVKTSRPKELRVSWK